MGERREGEGGRGKGGWGRGRRTEGEREEVGVEEVGGAKGEDTGSNPDSCTYIHLSHIATTEDGSRQHLHRVHSTHSRQADNTQCPLSKWDGETEHQSLLLIQVHLQRYLCMCILSD